MQEKEKLANVYGDVLTERQCQNWFRSGNFEVEVAS